jgi:hypothetical protein
MLRTLRAFGVVLTVTVGITSQLYQVYKKEVINSYKSVQPKLESLAKCCSRELVYIQALRWLQL